MILDKPPYRLIPEPAAPDLPGRRKVFADESFGTPLVQLTDAADGTNCRISYGIWSAFSCDYSKILIQCDSLFKIVIWNPVTRDGWGDIPLPASFQGADAIWSHSDPGLIYHRDGGSRMMLLNVVTGEDVVVFDADALFPDSPYLSRMSGSIDDNIFCFARQTATYGFSGFCVYNVKTKEIYSEPPSRAGQYFKVQIDKSGRFMWNVALDPKSEWWDLSLPNSQETKLTQGTGHSAMLTGLISQYDNNANVDKVGVPGGDSKTVIAWPDWEIATEYSGSDADESWYAVAANSLVPVGVLHDELIQVATDGSGDARRLCHMQNVMVGGDYSTESQPATGYGAYPWIAFHSSWGNRPRRDVFLAMPEKQHPAPLSRAKLPRLLPRLSIGGSLRRGH